MRHTGGGRVWGSASPVDLHPIMHLGGVEHSRSGKGVRNRPDVRERGSLDLGRENPPAAERGRPAKSRQEERKERWPSFHDTILAKSPFQKRTRSVMQHILSILGGRGNSSKNRRLFTQTWRTAGFPWSPVRTAVRCQRTCASDTQPLASGHDGGALVISCIATPLPCEDTQFPTRGPDPQTGTEPGRPRAEIGGKTGREERGISEGDQPGRRLNA